MAPNYSDTESEMSGGDSMASFDSDGDSEASDRSLSSISVSRKGSRAGRSTATTLRKYLVWTYFKDKISHSTFDSDEDKWLFLFKVIGVSLVPVLSVVIVFARSILQSSESLRQVAFTESWMSNQLDIQDLVSNLQHERALVITKYINVGGKGIDDEHEFIKKYIHTDQALDRVVSYDNWTAFWMGHIHINSYGVFRYYLWLNRLDPNSGGKKDGADSMVEFYAGAISHFMNEMTSKSLKIKNARVGRSSSVGIVISRAKEALGNIHALGCAYFYTGNIEEKDRLTIGQLHNFKNDIIVGARFQSLTFRRMYNDMYLENDTFYVDEMLAQVRGLEKIKHGPDILHDWYTNITEYMNVLNVIRKMMYDEVEDEIHNDLMYAQAGLLGIGVVLAILLLMLPILYLSAYRMATNLHTFTANIAGNMKEIKNEKKAAEDILLKMLPPSVARTLKLKKPVMPQVFESVTIFFSDVVGFTSISAKSTPMQVVAFLNQLYDFFDNVISNYDAYKVETIGDAYMVSSGLPIKNGERHAHEIAAMAIDLRDGIEQMQIPHMVMHKLQLRIGLHSGPCVAGVVGNKMPRYCLFGETVQIASKMESTGVPQKIQITNSTHQRLLNLGGRSYITEFRDTLNIAGIGDVERFWLVGRRTEFNIPKTGVARGVKREKIVIPALMEKQDEPEPVPHKKLTKKDSSLFRKLRQATIKLLEQSNNKVQDIGEEDI